MIAISRRDLVTFVIASRDTSIYVASCTYVCHASRAGISLARKDFYGARLACSVRGPDRNFAYIPAMENAFAFGLKLCYKSMARESIFDQLTRRKL